METKPTESELEILQILWEKGEQTVREVNETLNRHRRVGYTTTLKIMQIMAEKGFLSRDTGSRTHVYHTNVPMEVIREGMTDHLVETVFRGSRTGLVLQALGNHRITSQELEEIKDLLQTLEKTDGRTD
ncbi:MAG: BlaI/MecI/CopY family transcriptional regulator [Bacteroidales bacterium]